MTRGGPGSSMRGQSDDSTREQDLHALDTALLSVARGYEEEHADTDEIQVDARGEIPGKKSASADPASNSDLTVATRLTAGFSRSTRAATPTMIVHVPPVPVPRRRWVRAVTAFTLLLAGVTLAAVVRLIATSATRNDGGPSAARDVLPGDAARAERTPAPVTRDDPEVSAAPRVDAASAPQPPHEARRAVALPVREVPRSPPDARGVEAAVPVAIDARDLDAGPRELPAPKMRELPLPRPTAPPTPRPDKNQTYNPFTGRPASR